MKIGVWNANGNTESCSAGEVGEKSMTSPKHRAKNLDSEPIRTWAMHWRNGCPRTCKWETGCSPEIMKRVTLTRQHLKVFWVILSSSGYIQCKYCEWREVLKWQCGTREPSDKTSIVVKKILTTSQKGKMSLRVRGSTKCCHFMTDVWERRLLSSGLQFHALPHGA